MKISVNDDILLYAFRYSLTRETNAPIKVMNSIIRNIDDLSINNIEKLIKEIGLSTDIGFKLHKDTWEGLKKDLEFELKIRNLKG